MNFNISRRAFLAGSASAGALIVMHPFAVQAQAKVGALSPREREVLAALVEGKANKVIGFELGISPRTVEVDRSARGRLPL